MGAEGDSNLDNDGAADLLADISSRLTHRILDLLVHPRAHEYDDEEIAELFVRIEMLFALHDRQMLPIAPDPQNLRELVDSFLTRWEAYHRAAGHEPPVKRRESMIVTFQELYRISIQVLQERGSFTAIDRDLDSMSDADRANAAAMKRVFDAVESIGNPDEPRSS
ncbi:MAG: hypothetical protein QOE70_4170 [Chthoniobacter sp.]|jgi:hypothetical protein|nr:hypothetical protein [Chthoniobacter sp.]